jgi:hypothetical protein
MSPALSRVLARFSVALMENSARKLEFPGRVFNSLFRKLRLAEMATIVAFNAWDGPIGRS